MKKTFLFSFILILSSHAYANIVPVRGSQKGTFSTKSTILNVNLPGASSLLNMRVDPNVNEISVEIELVAEDSTALSRYLSDWEINISGSPSSEITLNSTGNFARRKCEERKVNGVFKKLKGVCFEKINIIIPESLKPTRISGSAVIYLNSDQLSVSINNPVPSENVARLECDLKETMFDSDKDKVIRDFVLESSEAKFDGLKTDDLVRLVKAETFGSDKIDLIKLLYPLIKDKLAAHQELVKQFTFQSDKDKLAKMLLLNQK